MRLIGNHEAWCFDFEIFPNFSMVGFMRIDTGEIRTFSNVEGIGESFDALRSWWPYFSDGDRLLIGFNSMSYDNLLLHAVIEQGIDDADLLYQYSVSIIQGDKA